MLLEGQSGGAADSEDRSEPRREVQLTGFEAATTGSRISQSVLHSIGIIPPSGASTWLANRRTAAHLSQVVALSLQACRASFAAAASQFAKSLSNLFGLESHRPDIL